MERTIIIDGQEVRLRASAAIPRLYRIKYHRDLLVDMNEIRKQILAQKEAREKGQEDTAADAEPEISTLPVDTLSLFENVAHLMAKHADKDNVPSDVDEWLDGFQTFSIYQVFPVIEELWQENLRQLNAPQKK